MSVVTVTVSSDGQAIDATYQLLSVDVRRELNRQPSALLVYLDGDIAERSYPVSDSGKFDPGKEIQIKARYEGDTSQTDQLLFKGLVVRHAFESNAQGTLLRVELRDKSIKLTQPRRSQVLEKMKDSDLIKQLVSDAGLKADVEATTLQHATVVQYDCTDWDLLVGRAEANAMVVAVTDGTVRVAKPKASGAAAISVDYGISEVYDLEFETDAMGQDVGFKALSWDVKKQAAAEATGASAPAPGQGSATAKKLAQALGYRDAVLVHPVNLQPDEAKAWADSEAQRGALAMVRGRLRLPGDGKAALLQAVELKGVPKAFAGKALVSGLCHRIDGDGWVTDLQFGLSPRPHRSRPDITAPAAAGLWPAVSGLQIGIVEAVHEDPDKECRIKVKLPALGSNAPGYWARMAMPDAGKDRGWYFWPEPGDEVVLGFFNQDPRQPVVLGAMYGSTNKPPADIVDDSADNTKRGLVTKKALTLAFVDADKPQLYLQTPGGAKVLLDDDQEVIELSDKHGNKLTMNKDGVAIVSAKDFKVDASGNVEVKGSKVDLK
ncbi:MAG: type VI secretion system tip protein VgrG [Burkholderiaceae bacterium]|nr:type VI secretion system tip protein VgrG [Burkholderiaceae bacterium]